MLFPCSREEQNMQNTERAVLKRNNHPVFIYEFTDNVVDYLLWFCFLWRATLNLLEQPL